MGERKVNHDLEDLAELLKMIEERLILVERRIESLRDHRSDDQSWYWLFG
jgi:N-acetylglutamate synthase-like GNAT family acetyltransferase